MSKDGTTVYSTVKGPCMKAESDVVGCLNGGTCFNVPMQNGNKITGCSCTDEWDGPRCEFQFVDPDLWAHGANVASIAAGIAVGVFLLLASIVGVVIYCWRYRRNRRQPNSEAVVSVRSGDSVLVPPGESKPIYDACSKTNLTLDGETTTSLGAEVSRSEYDVVVSASPSSSASAAAAATGEAVSTTHHPSVDQSPADHPSTDEECTDHHHHENSSKKRALLSL